MTRLIRVELLRASAATPLPFAAAAALLAGLAILFCVMAARTTVARDVS